MNTSLIISLNSHIAFMPFLFNFFLIFEEENDFYIFPKAAMS